MTFQYGCKAKFRIAQLRAEVSQTYKELSALVKELDSRSNASDVCALPFSNLDVSLVADTINAGCRVSAAQLARIKCRVNECPQHGRVEASQQQNSFCPQATAHNAVPEQTPTQLKMRVNGVNKDTPSARQDQAERDAAMGAVLHRAAVDEALREAVRTGSPSPEACILPIPARRALKFGETLNAKKLTRMKSTMKLQRKASMLAAQSHVDLTNAAQPIEQSWEIDATDSGTSAELTDAEKLRVLAEQRARLKRAAIEGLCELRTVDEDSIAWLVAEVRRYQTPNASKVLSHQCEDHQTNETTGASISSRAAPVLSIDGAFQEATKKTTSETVAPPVVGWLHADEFRNILLRYIGLDHGTAQEDGCDSVDKSENADNNGVAVIDDATLQSHLDTPKDGSSKLRSAEMAIDRLTHLFQPRCASNYDRTTNGNLSRSSILRSRRRDSSRNSALGNGLVIGTSTIDTSNGSPWVDFREVVVALGALVPCDIYTRIKVFFSVYGDVNDGVISIRELCSILHNGDAAVLELLDYAEEFMSHLDEDGDGTVTWEEFRNAVTREPLILESFMSALPSVGLAPSQLEEQLDVRNFVHRSNLTWRLLNDIWAKLKHAAGAMNGAFIGENRSDEIPAERTGDSCTPDDEWSPNHIEVLIDSPTYHTVMFPFLTPPLPEDGPLLRRIFNVFTEDSKALPADPLAKKLIKCREFVGALAGQLRSSKLGISDVEDKAEFYFAMYNVDDDFELSREEIYRMLYASHGEIGRRILDVNKALDTIDKDGDGLIDFDEYVAAASNDKRLTSFFEH